MQVVKKTKETLGERIARLRGKTSQIAFAEAADMSRRTLQNIEDGTTESPGIDAIVKIAGALGLSTSELLAEPKPVPRELIGRVIEAPEEEDSLRVASLLMAQFAAAPPRLRAVALAYLFQDFEIMRKYHKEIVALMPKP